MNTYGLFLLMYGRNSTQSCEATILQLKISIFLKRRKKGAFDFGVNSRSGFHHCSVSYQKNTFLFHRQTSPQTAADKNVSINP